MEYKEKKECICCCSTNLKQVLDLHDQPLANSYHRLWEELVKFPLKLNLCTNCYHLQLSHIVNPNLLFKNYLYVSGTTSTLKKFFEWFSKFAIEMSNKKNGSVLDIACNDGSQLDAFKRLGWDTYGIDPAENLFELSSKNHHVICDYFSYDKLAGKKFDVITAQNVFAHNENAKAFLDDCEKLMDKDSLLFIQTSQSELIKNGQFDTIYHEHISFFNINSFNELAKRTGLNLINVVKTPVHGISYIFILSKNKHNETLIDNLISVESEYGLMNLDTYEEYANKVNSIASKFREVVHEFKNNGYVLMGYGAAAKGMTLLNFAEVRLDFIIDDNKLKQGLFTPGSDIEIISVDELMNYGDNEKILFIPLAWNFFNEIVHRIKEKRDNPNDVFMKYFPDVTIFRKND